MATPSLLICFGDSITAGAHASPGFGWIDVLPDVRPEVCVVPAGVSGRTSEDIEGLRTVLMDHPQADGLLIFLGINDLKDADAARTEACLSRIAAMVELTRTLRPDITDISLCTPAGLALERRDAIVAGKLYNERTVAACERLALGLRDLAARNNCRYIYLLGVVSPEHFSDGLHPNDAGHTELANAIGKALG